MNCCPNCFNDTYLEGVIRQNSLSMGNCDFCKLQDTEIISPQKLNYYFQPLFSLYDTSDTEGESIAKLLKKDWIIFQTLSDEDTIKLLECILEVELQTLYLPNKNTVEEEKIINWQGFREELKHDNRYFPQKAPNIDDLDALLNYVTISNDQIPQYLYRSRVNIDTDRIDIAEMGKPPAKFSTAGRANPIGIPYLYTASNHTTAIAEIRPHKGDIITVAKYEIKETVKLADLRNPRQSISPFLLDEDALKQLFMDLDYLCHLGDELSKPILPRVAHLEYLSTQYLCELIKHCGFNGVIYKSSVGDGDNYAFFTEDKVEALETKLYSVNEVDITSILL